MKLSPKFKQLSWNHAILLLLCAVIGYLMRAHDSYELRPVWRKRAEYHHFENKKFPKKEEQLPAPIVTDLDSDGVNEIILITNDLKLSVMTLPDSGKKDEEDRTLPHVVVKHKVVLPQASNDTDEGEGQPSGWPVVMVTGFTVPYLSMMQIRRQSIVIVTNTWWVLCYSANLDLLWKRQVLDFKDKFNTYHVKSMGALVTGHSVRKTDEGMVIVGGSFAHNAHQEEKEETGNETHTDHGIEEDTLTHFSTIALNGRDGDVRWHHLPGEFGEQVDDKKTVDASESHWKLSLKRHRLHVGESPWTFYKQELYKSLPHHWRHLRDTRFTLGRYQKVVDETVYGEEEEEPTAQVSTQSALDAKHIIGYAYGGQRPHSDIEHVTNPNAVVINNQKGIEVLNILNGRPITRLPLPEDGGIYAVMDSEGDIKKMSWGEQANYSPCFLEIWRIFPIKENLERFPVCLTKRLFFTTNWVYEEDMYVKLPPFILKSIARKSGVVRHLLGHHLRKETDQYDLIAIGSLGRITSVDKNGDFNWQSQVSATWDGVAMQARKTKKGEWSETNDEFFNSFQPDRQLMSLQLYGEKVNLLIVGWKDISLLEVTEGRLLAQHSIPCPPTGPLVSADFNNDGYNDVILTCKYGYIGFSLHRQSNHLYTMLYGVAVFLTILVIAWFLSPDRHKLDDTDDEDESN